MSTQVVKLDKVGQISVFDAFLFWKKEKRQFFNNFAESFAKTIGWN